MQQTVLTFIAPVKPTEMAALDALLREARAGGDDNPLVPFCALPHLHFASLVLLPADRPFPPQLVFENNFDGPLETYLADLVKLAGGGLHQIYCHCEGYPTSGDYDPAALATYLRRHVVWPNAYHVGAVGMSLSRIRREAALREHLELTVDGLTQAGQLGTTPSAIRRQLQAAILNDPEWAWVRATEPVVSPLERWLPRLQLGLVWLAGVALFPVVTVVGIGTLLAIQRREQRDRPWTGKVSDVHLAALLATENEPGIVQNHVTSLSRVKRGWLRRAVLTFVLWYANRQGRADTSGTLSGISTIHFAHWSMIDGGRRLLFLSNFGGSWGSYLDDFIDKASDGLTGIWSNCEGFPRTEYQFFSNRKVLSIAGGARNGSQFKAVVRDRQLPTNVWHSPYPRLTVAQIARNRALRVGLFASMDERGERQWLRNL